MSYGCEICGFKLYVPVAELRVSWLGLYDDARYPGRCLVVLNEHHEHLQQLDRDLRHHFLDDIDVAMRAIADVTEAERVNMAVLGNTEPHLHGHLIPRVPDGDPVPDRPHWEDPRPRPPLDGDLLAGLVSRLQEALP